MNLHGSRASRALATAAAALTVLAGTLAGTSAACAAPASPAYFNRTAVIGRAARWTSRGVPYSQTSWVDDYRSDCSGFVSYAWGLDQSFVTWTLPEVAQPIGKQDLQPGDIILNTARHVIIFGGWADGAHSAYLGYEEAGAPQRAVRRVIRYPYDSPTAAQYKPYRYTGGHNLHAPGSYLQGPLIQTYAGGSTLVPSWAAQTNITRVRIAEKAARRHLDQVHAQQRAQAAAELDAARQIAPKAAARTVTPPASAKPAPHARPRPQAAPPAPVIVQIVQGALALLGRF